MFASRTLDDLKPLQLPLVAEFIKHALGLMHTHPGRAVTLLGLYREPLNAAHHVHFEEHRREVAAFTVGPPGRPSLSSR